MEYFNYGSVETEYLKSNDKLLGEVIDRIGHIYREINTDLFYSIVDSIIGQQISSKAAKTVMERLKNLTCVINPLIISKMDVEKIQQCGMTLRKAGYIKNIADKVMTGELNLDEFYILTDDVIIKKLAALDGIGIWTAEMLLIFALCRQDIVSYGDLAIRRGMMKLYGLNELTKKDFEHYRKRYSPYGTIASLYLWKYSCE